MANITDVLTALESVISAIDHTVEIISPAWLDQYPNEIEPLTESARYFKPKVNRLISAIYKSEYDADPYDPSREGHPNEYL